jgi:hypothetical protein
LGALVCSSGWADAPTSSGDAATAEPDDSFIEFLGGDDVGDAGWWEFLKSADAAKTEDGKQ